MDTIYMTWLTGALVLILVLLATRSREMVPSGVQNGGDRREFKRSVLFHSRGPIIVKRYICAE